MIKKRLFFLPLFLSALALTALGTLPAQAQSRNQEREERSSSGFINQYDDKYKPAFLREQENSQPPALLPSHIMFIKSLKAGRHGDNEIQLAVSTPFPVHGCALLTPPTADVSYDEFARMVIVTLTPGKISAQKKPRYGHFDCQGAPASLDTPFTLDLETIRQADINRLTLVIDSTRSTFPFELDEHAFRIASAASSHESRGGNIFITGEFTHWFLPEGSIVLFTADARQSGSDLMADLHQFAHRHGMEPLEAFIPGFEEYRDLKIKNLPYYKTHAVLVDKRGDISKNLTADRPEVVGSLEVRDGPKPRLINIFAMKL